MNQDPLTNLVVAGIAAYLARLWLADYAGYQTGRPNPKPLPGATTVGWPLVLFGGLVAVALVLFETWGESLLGIAAQQSTVTWLFLLGMVSAGVIEEIVFRGFLVIEGRGRAVLVSSIVGFSALFALLHFHWLDWTGLEEGLVALRLTRAAGWWTLLLFVNSLFFYWLRFTRWNLNRSLLPCFVAHIASNVAVFLVKLGQGFVVGAY